MFWGLWWSSHATIDIHDVKTPSSWSPCSPSNLGAWPVYPLIQVWQQSRSGWQWWRRSQWQCRWWLQWPWSWCCLAIVYFHHFNQDQLFSSTPITNVCDGSHYRPPTGRIPCIIIIPGAMIMQGLYRWHVQLCIVQLCIVHLCIVQLCIVQLCICRWDCEQTRQVWTACSSIQIQPKPWRHLNRANKRQNTIWIELKFLNVLSIPFYLFFTPMLECRW